MPRPMHAQGRPGTQVIPADWSTTHAPVATKTMTGVASLRHPGTIKTWDDVDQQNITSPLLPYAAEVPVRVQAVRAQAVRQDVEAAEESVQIAGYLVTVPLGTAGATATDDLVDVTAADDPLLVGRTLRVVEVIRGTVRFERDLFCTLS